MYADPEPGQLSLELATHCEIPLWLRLSWPNDGSRMLTSVPMSPCVRGGRENHRENPEQDSGGWDSEDGQMCIDELGSMPDPVKMGVSDHSL